MLTEEEEGEVEFNENGGRREGRGDRKAVGKG